MAVGWQGQRGADDSMQMDTISDVMNFPKVLNMLNGRRQYHPMRAVVP